jgi:DnaJ domain
MTPYSAEFIEALKAAVPWRYRSFDGEAKHWIVRQPYVDVALDVAGQYYEMTQYFTTQDASPSTPLHPVEECLRRVQAMWREHADLYVLPHAPWTVIQAAYRALALLVHPDRGGSHQRMVEVNRAYQGLRDQRERAEQRRSQR